MRRNGEKEAQGDTPWTPFPYGPLICTRSFWRLCRIVSVVGLFRCPSMCPDLETFFHKMLFSIFFLENASQIGLRIPEVIDSLPYQKQRSQKSASGNERPLTQGGGGNPVLRTLGVGCSEAPLGRSAPGAPPARRGSPFLPRNGEKEGRGCAPGPRFHGRSFPLAGFGDGWLWYGRGAITNGILKPIWDAFFGKICWKAFLRKKVSKSGYADGYRTSSTTVPLCPTTPKRASGNERPLKPGGAGALPRDSLRPGFL